NYSSNRLIRTNDMRPSSTSPRLGVNEPNFAAGVDWRAQHVPLPTNAISQRNVALGVDRADQGLYLGSDIHSLEIWAGDANGAKPELRNGKWTPPARYQYLESCVAERYWHQGSGWWDPGGWRTRLVCTTYRFDENGTFQTQREDGAWETRARDFNGVIFVDGKMERFTGPERRNGHAPPAIASFAEMTLTSTGDVRIRGDLRYEEPPCSSQPSRRPDRSVIPAECDNLGHANVLGVDTQGGDSIA